MSLASRGEEPSGGDAGGVEPKDCSARRGWGWFGTILVTLAIILVGRVVLWVMEHGITGANSSPTEGTILPSWILGNAGALWALTIIVCGTVELALVAAWLWIRHRAEWLEVLAMRRVPVRVLVFWSAGAVLFAAGCDLVTWLCGRPIVPDAMRVAYTTSVWTGFLWLALVGVAPVVEEVLFRGFLFSGVEQSVLGRWGAIGVSTAIWTATHVQYDTWGIIIVALAGVLLGWARSHTRSVVVTWFMHMLLNAIAVTEAMLVVGSG
jgi:membrane protease YdiL (CAAX protease family)